MLPDLGVLIAALLCASFGAAVVLLIVGVRGVVPDPTRPPGRLRLTGRALMNPALTGRLAAAVIIGVLALLLTRWPVAAVGLGGLIAAWPLLFGGTRAEQMEIDRLEALVVWTESMRDTISGNAGLEQAVAATAQNAPPLIQPALIRLVGQLRARVPLDKALMALATWLNDASADLVLAALILSAKRRGDGLADALSRLSLAAREELEMRRRVSANRAGLRRGMQLVVAMTIAFGVFLVTVGQSYVAPYNTFGGQIALAVVLGIFASGFAWMRRLSESPPVMPFLARPGQRPENEDVALVSRLTGLTTTAATELSAEPQRGLARAGTVRR